MDTERKVEYAITVKEKSIKRAIEINEILHAVAILEWHDKNWFNSTEGSRMEMKEDLLKEQNQLLSEK